MKPLNTGRLQHELVRNNMKQRDLANAVGVSEVSMSRYVNGTRMPKGDILVRIAEVLRTTLEYLTNEEGMEPPDVSYNKVKVAIKAYGGRWHWRQKKELINMLVDTLADE